MKIQLKDIKKKVPNIYEDEKLSNYSWFNIGGPAEIFFRPTNVSEIKKFVEVIKDYNFDFNIIGAGSNTLIRDSGVKGITIKLSSKFSHIKIIDKDIIEVGAATLDKKVSEFALKNLLSGFEFLSCIPGSIGGGIIMNSGCYGEDISKILISIETINLKGEIKILDREKINFKYRGSDLPNDLIILSAKFRGKIESKENIQKKQLKLISKKKIDQPSKIKTCGSTFKNPNNFKAWQLIKKSNCDKMEVGEIKISEKHCNFFVNKGKGTSKEIEKLISEIKKKVYEKTGINLELEIKIIGTK